MTGRQFNISDVLSRGWEAYLANFWMIMGGVILSLICNGTQAVSISLLSTGIRMGLEAAVGGVFAVFVGVGLDFILQFVTLAIQIFFTLGLLKYLLNIFRGENPNLVNLFEGAPFLIRGYLATLLEALIIIALWIPYGLGAVMTAVLFQNNPIVMAAILISVGIVFVVATIIIQLMLSQKLYCIVDRNTGIVDSLTMSRELMAGNKLMLFLFQLIWSLFFVTLLLGAVLLAAFVHWGTLFATIPAFLPIFLFFIPYISFCNALIYETISGGKKDDLGLQLPAV